MDPPGGAGPPGADTDERLSEAYGWIRSALVFSPLTPTEAEDIAQEVCLLVQRKGMPLAACPRPYLAGVARHLARGYRRGAARRRYLESRSGEVRLAGSQGERLAALESKEVLDRLAEALPEPERSLLNLIRSGHTLAAAGRMLGIPRGSVDYHYERLIAYGLRLARRTGLGDLGAPSSRRDCSVPVAARGRGRFSIRKDTPGSRA